MFDVFQLGDKVIRLNRNTGEVWLLTDGKWVKVSDNQ